MRCALIVCRAKWTPTKMDFRVSTMLNCCAPRTFSFAEIFKCRIRTMSLRRASPGLFGQSLGKIEPVSLPIESYYPDHRPFVETDLLAQAKADIERAETDLRKKQEEYAAVEKELANASLDDRL